MKHRTGPKISSRAPPWNYPPLTESPLDVPTLGQVARPTSAGDDLGALVDSNFHVVLNPIALAFTDERAHNCLRVVRVADRHCFGRAAAAASSNSA